MEVHGPPGASGGPPPDGEVSKGRRRRVLAGLTVATFFTVFFVVVTVWIAYSVITDHWHQHHPWYYGVQIQTLSSACSPQ
jgi:ABC-type Fe3+ transport system permease subunit